MPAQACQRWLQAQATFIDGASLRWFRLVFGLLMTFGMARFFAYDWIEQFYVTPLLHFRYAGFEWIEPWPAPWIHLHFALTGIAALVFAAGFFYRPALAMFLVGFLYIELLDKTTYLNHYYLVSLLAALMLLMPLGRMRAFGASSSVPRWCLTTLRFQVGLVYFFAGLAKLKPDWLLEGEPLRLWFAANDDLPLLGPYLNLPGVAHLASWTAALMDLSVPFALTWRRTRPYAFAVVVAFHLVTAACFNLGLFPWLMIAGATLFFPPDWPRALVGKARASSPAALAALPLTRRHAALAGVLAAHFLFQTIWPLRHFAYPGNVLWSEDGYRFAWHVMLMEKAGRAVYQVRDPASGTSWRIDPQENLTRFQYKMLTTQPDLILQYAHALRDDFASQGMSVEVRAESHVALNTRAMQAFVDPAVDLARVDADDRYATWILPLEAAKTRARARLELSE